MPRLLPNTLSSLPLCLSAHHTDQQRVLFSYPNSLTSQWIQLTESHRIFCVCQCHTKTPNLFWLSQNLEVSYLATSSTRLTQTSITGPREAEEGHEASKLTDKLTDFLFSLRNLAHVMSVSVLLRLLRRLCTP